MKPPQLPNCSVLGRSHGEATASSDAGAFRNGGGGGSWQGLLDLLGVQHYALWLWSLACVTIIAACMGGLSSELVDFFYLYYQPLAPVLFMLWLWGAAVRAFESRGIKYDVCFSNADQKYLLPSRSLFQVRLWCPFKRQADPCVCLMFTTARQTEAEHRNRGVLTKQHNHKFGRRTHPQIAATVTTGVLTSAAVFVYQCSTGRTELAGLQPQLLYCGLLLLLLVPVNWLFKARL